MPLWDNDDGFITKLIAASAAGMVLGFGLCGLIAAVGAGEYRALAYVAIAGSVLFFLSGSVLLLSILVLVVQGVIGVFRGPKV